MNGTAAVAARTVHLLIVHQHHQRQRHIAALRWGGVAAQPSRRGRIRWGIIIIKFLLDDAAFNFMNTPSSCR